MKAKHWRRNLTREEAEQRLANPPEVGRGLKLEAGGASSAANWDKPFAQPDYWPAFILIGDPE